MLKATAGTAVLIGFLVHDAGHVKKILLRTPLPPEKTVHWSLHSSQSPLETPSFRAEMMLTGYNYPIHLLPL